jgi:cyanophycinase-like exopeptidase
MTGDAAGPIGLHGGGEFQPGDEPFLRAILEAALPPTSDRPVRVVIVPTAAAGERPEMAVAFGSRAFESVAAGAGLAIGVEGVFVVDRASAADERLAARLAAAHLVYLPGGDPGRLAALLPGSVAWAAILRANANGAVIAGASAGAMVLAPWTWTPGGGAPGLGLVPGIVVVPHAERVGQSGWQGTFAERTPAAAGSLAPLGLDERTGILSVPGTGSWRVIGEGRVYLGATPAEPPGVFESGDLLTLPDVSHG